MWTNVGEKRRKGINAVKVRLRLVFTDTFFLLIQSLVMSVLNYYLSLPTVSDSDLKAGKSPE